MFTNLRYSNSSLLEGGPNVDYDYDRPSIEVDPALQHVQGLLEDMVAEDVKVEK